MAQAKHGDTVKVHYTGRLNEEAIFDSSEGREPLEFKIGGKQVIPGFENAVIGMSIDESKTFTIPSEEAYGPYREDMVIDVPHSQFPPNIQPQIGQQLNLKQDDGEIITVTVSHISESGISLDANHPLAGKDLTFDIKLTEIF